MSQLLEEAIVFILQSGQVSNVGPDVSQNLSRAFFSSCVGVDGNDALKFWQGQFKTSELKPFPSDPAPNHSSRVRQTLTRRIQGRMFLDAEFDALTVVWTGWAVLQSHIQATQGALFGATIDNQKRASTFPAYVAINFESTVKDTLNQVEEQRNGLTRYGRTGLLRIGLLGGKAKQACQFQTMLIVKNAEHQSATRDQAKIAKTLREQSKLEALALIIELTITGSSTTFQYHFDTGAFERNQICRLASQFEHVLSQFCVPTLSNARICDIQAANELDLADIWRWNANRTEAVNECVHDMVTAMAKGQLNASAVCAWDGELTYSELEELSSRLANHLTELEIDIGPEVLVPLCFEKSMWMPVAMLGVMKAGAASVALDVTQPVERLRRISQQVNPRVVVCSAQNASLAAQMSDTPLRIIIVDRSSFSVMSTRTPQVLRSTVQPANTVYVAFTSGTTGEPKGVQITHSNLASALRHQNSTLGFTQASRVLDFASYAFDVAWYNAFQTFTAGGCLCIPSEEDRKNDVAGAIRRLRATSATLTPTLAEILDEDTVRSLHVLELGGEAVGQQLIERMSSLTRVRIAYGPVECTIRVTWARKHLGEQSIGFAVGASVWIIHPITSLPVGVGCSGELWIEGPLVGRGYLNDPVSTRAKFIDNPQWLINGTCGYPGRHGRLYKTGDLARLNEDGSIAFLGRMDSQVKIRGQRVELAEVESHILRLIERERCHLSQHIRTASPQLQETWPENSLQVVAEAATPKGSDRVILVAFIAPSGSFLATQHEKQLKETIAKFTSGLNHHLKLEVPSYMVPAAYLPLRTMPTTTTGKIDRRRLRELVSTISIEEVTGLGLNRVRKPLTTLAEKQLQQLWTSVLGLAADQIDSDDSFFRLGGDSIGVMRLVSLARSQGFFLKAADVFIRPTLGELAGCLEMVIHEELVTPFSLLHATINRQEARMAVASLCGVDCEQVEDIYPCTPLQEGLLAMTSRDAGDYVARFRLELSSEVCLVRLEQALRSVVAGVPILRTRFTDLPHQGLVQVVIREPLDLSSQQNRHSRPVDDAETTKVTALGTPLSHMTVLEQDKKLYLQWSIHHALYDGWLLQLLLGAIADTYHARESVRLAPFQPFIRHTRALITTSKSFWEKEFAGFRAQHFPLLPSIAFQPRADTMLQKNVHGLGRSPSGFTIATAIRTAWSILVASYTNELEAVFGAVVSGRQASVADIERVAGPTIATVPVRVVLDAKATMEELLQQIQTQAAEMSVHEQTGIQNIQLVSAEAREACRFQSLLVVQPQTQNKDDNGAGDHALFVTCESGGSQGLDMLDAFSTYALTVVCEQVDEDIIARFSSDSRVVSHEKLNCLASQFEHILRLVCHPQNLCSSVVELDLASEQDVDIIRQFNSSSLSPVEIPVHELFEKVARHQPDAPAICAWDGNFSHGQLEDFSNRLAQRLVNIGIGPGAIVPLSFEKSRWSSVAMLGVMKTGAASVALDVNQPENRLRSIVRQVQPLAIVSSSSSSELAARLVSSVFIFVVDQTRIESMPGGGPLTATTKPSDPVYLAFTSGSTGEPKGVIITHSNVSSGIELQRETLEFNRSSRVYDFASYAFDVAWYNTLHTLTAGGCVCVPSEYDRKNDLSASIIRLQATSMTLTPSVAETVDPEVIATLRYIELGGEVVSESLIKRLLPLTRVRVAYGPVECTVGATWAWKDRGDDGIGRGVGARTWVISPITNRLVGIGWIGELWIEGPLVGQGYLDDEEKTSRAFVNNPPWLVGIGEQGRCYKTGDLVRYNKDGSLEFLGRADGQVKLRGQRVELSEVEHHVLSVLTQPNNANRREGTQVVAEVITPRGGRPTLVAFVSPAEGHKMSSEMLASVVADLTRGADNRLAKILPIYMIPNAFVPLADVVTSTTGKVDRKRIRDTASAFSTEELFDLASAGQTKLQRLPSSMRESQLQHAWATILGIEPDTINVDDNFFRLGGDSIQAMRLVAELQRQRTCLTVADVFRHPTISELALVTVDIGSSAVETVKPFSLLEPPINADMAISHAALVCNVDYRDIEDIYPCTPLQEGMMALTARRSGDYVAKLVLELLPGIPIDQLKKAWVVTVASNPILRTRIVDLPGRGLVQVVLKAAEARDCIEDKPLPVKHEDTEFLGSRLSELRIVTEEGTGIRNFAWSIHHALYDGWSLPSILDALKINYHLGPTLDNRKPQLAPFQPFIKHVVEMHSNSATRFWENQFRGLDAQRFPLLDTVGYQPRADFVWKQAIKGLPRPPAGFTLSTVVRATWSILTASYVNSPEVVFGAVVSGRQVAIPGIEQITGPTISTVPVRVQIGHDMQLSVKQLLQQVQDQATEMTNFEQTGLQNIQRISPEAAEACSFQTLVVVQPQRQASNTDKALFVESESNDERLNLLESFSTYAVTLVCAPSGTNDIVLTLSIDSSVVHADQARRIAAQFEHLLRQIYIHDHGRLCDVLYPDEKDVEDIWGWNANAVRASDECVHDIVASTVRRQPHAPAICAWDGELSFAELDDFSSRLAGCLIDQGVGPEVAVPLCFEKSMWTPVAMLAVMKAGGASVALDVTQPEARLQRIIDQVAPIVVVSSAENAPLGARLSGCNKQIVIDRARLLAMPLQHPARVVGVKTSNAVYLCFTSGSSGEPKGVVITHSNLASAIEAQRTALEFGPGSRIFDFASYAFDVAWYNAFQTLTAGGCMCIPSEFDRRNDLSGSILRLRPTAATFTPTVAEALEPAAVQSLDLLELGGEAVSKAQIERMSALARVRVAYGPVECTIGVTWSWKDGSDKASEGIGRGLGAQTWVVHPTMTDRLVGIGCIGELWIEGPLVARGYLNNPEKTAAAFVTNPEWLMRGSSDHRGRGGRLYRTGDLVRHNEDGSLTFAGRADGQVKIRGQRIELGEIEHLIKERLQIVEMERDGGVAMTETGTSAKDTVRVVAETVALQSNQGRTTLVAFITPSDAHSMTTDALSEAVATLTAGVNDQLSSTVPSYMVPAMFIPLKALPISTTGKVDRRCLREIGAALSTDELAILAAPRKSERMGPLSAKEMQLQQLWASVLSLDDSLISAESNFLQLGGDSIQAMRLVATAQRAGLSLTVADVVSNPILHKMALCLGASPETSIIRPARFSLLNMEHPGLFIKDTLLPELSIEDVADIEDVLPVTHSQRPFMDGALDGGPLGVNCFFLDLPKSVDPSQLASSCDMLVQHFEILRTVFVAWEQDFYQIILKRLEVPLEVFEVAHLSDDVCVWQELRQQSNKLGRTLLRLVLVCSAEGAKRLVVRISHAQYDGIAFARILSTLSDIYGGETLLQEPSLSSLTLHHQKQLDFAYWNRLLNDATMSNLTSQPSQDQQSSIIRMERLKPLPTAFKTSGKSPATVFTSACAIMIGRITGSQDVLFGRLVSGRGALPAGLRDIVCPCITTLPVRIRLNAQEGVMDEVQRQFVQSLSHENIGIEQLQAHCTSWPSDSHEFGFVTQYQNIDENPSLRIAGASVSVQHDFSPVDDMRRSNTVQIVALPYGSSLKLILNAKCGRAQAGMVLDGICDALDIVT